MLNNLSVDDLIAMLRWGDIPNRIEACRKLETMVHRPEYGTQRSQIKRALEDAYEQWGHLSTWAKTTVE